MRNALYTSRIDWFNKQGQRIEWEDYVQLMRDQLYPVVDYNVVGVYEVNTRWFGFDLEPHFEGAPVIFETIVFDHSTARENGHPMVVSCQRWATLQEAVDGHAAALKEYRSSKQHRAEDRRFWTVVIGALFLLCLLGWAVANGIRL